MPNAIFRADATPQLGGGHIYRCLTLAHALAAEGWTCSFAANPGADQVVPWLERSGFPRVDISALANTWSDLLVVDHYDVGCREETKLRSAAGRILVIDDLANRKHDADMLLDQNVGRHPVDYKELVPQHCRIMTGPGYALLRPAFGKMRLAGWHPRRALRTILVSMGATDAANATALVLSGLATVPDIHVNVVLGAAAVHLVTVGEQIKSLGDSFSLFVEVDDTKMAELICEADLAIAAAGGSAWERCSLGLPTLLVLLAENQRSSANHLVALGAARWLGTLDNSNLALQVTAVVRELLDDPAQLTEMSSAAARICDGLGAPRIAGLLSPENCKDDTSVVLRPAETADEEIIFTWQNVPGVRRYFHEQKPPTATEHAAWFEGSLANPERLLNIIEVNGKPAGILRLDRIDTADNATGQGFMVSILVQPDFSGRGVAKAALRAARRLMAGQRLVAEIVNENVASRRAFEASGFHAVGGHYVTGGH